MVKYKLKEGFDCDFKNSMWLKDMPIGDSLWVVKSKSKAGNYYKHQESIIEQILKNRNITFTKYGDSEEYVKPKEKEKKVKRKKR